MICRYDILNKKNEFDVVVVDVDVVDLNDVLTEKKIVFVKKKEKKGSVKGMKKGKKGGGGRFR